MEKNALASDESRALAVLYSHSEGTSGLMREKEQMHKWQLRS